MINLLTLATPFAKKLAIKGFEKLKDKTKEKLMKKAKEKIESLTKATITSQSDFDKSLEKLTPEELLELKKLTINGDIELAKIAMEEEKLDSLNFKYELKNGDDLSKTWKDEFSTSFILIFVATVFICGFFNPDNTTDAIYALVDLFNTYFGVAFLVTVSCSMGLKSFIMKIGDALIKKYS